jgi:ubiquinone/menaquinone biosynthesis C-methylase UbiE
MKQVIHDAAAKGFQVAADAYERGRPEYPIESVLKLIQELHLTSGKTVVDLGAGTGKFTKLLADNCEAQVVAIEPVEGMRRKFSSLLPAVKIFDGTAEASTLTAASVDAVVVAQAFHWFDGEKALPEIHRILKPNGYLGMIWNARDESLPWVAELTNIIDPFEKGAPRYKSGKWKLAFLNSPLFTPLQSAQYRYVQKGDVQMVVDRIASISFISALASGEKESVLEQVRNLLESSPETKGRSELELPYRTDVFWCQKKDMA